MPEVIARIRVEDYDRWKAARDAGRQRRFAAGRVISEKVFRHPRDPQEVLLLREVEDQEYATRAFQTPEHRARREAAGLLERVTYQLAE
jgi:hypothetical protein